MKNILNRVAIILLSITVIGLSSSCTQQKTSSTIVTNKTELLNKIKGGWAGKTIGCTYGGPVEFVFNGTMIQDYTPIHWADDFIEGYYESFPGLYDDVYVNITFMNVIERLGLKAPADSFALAFANQTYPLWHANQAAKYNIKRGIMPPLSGHWLNNPHADDIDYQIESDYSGLMCPAMPNTASTVNDKVGHIFNYGDGWYGGVFTGAMYSLAFVYDSPLVIVKEALKTIPKQSDFYQCVNEVLIAYEKDPSDWKSAWFELQKKWSSEVGCSFGVFAPLNIDAKINSAYVAIGLLYGEGDFFKTMDIATRCGQDSDCNAATAVGVLGTMMGYDAIPDYWINALKKVENRKIPYTNLTYIDLYDMGLKHALMVIEQEGGQILDDEIIIKYQQPVEVAFEKSFIGHYPTSKTKLNKVVEQLDEFTFNGIGILFMGYVSSTDKDYEAQVEMYINDQLIETAILPTSCSDAVDNRRTDLFWKYQLEKKDHKVTFKWLNPTVDSTVYFSEALVYSDVNR